VLSPKDEPAAKEEFVAAAEPPPLSILKDRTIEVDDTILDDDGDVIGEVTEGNAERFYSISARCDDEGNVIDTRGRRLAKSIPWSMDLNPQPMKPPVTTM
jgi:hypothetical protein